MAVEIINCVNSDIRAWMAANLRMINDDKTELAIFGTLQQLSKLDTPLTVKSGDELILSLDKVKDHHISNVIKLPVYYLHNIARIQKFLTFDACVSVVNVFISLVLTTATLSCTVSLIASSEQCRASTCRSGMPLCHF